MHISKESLEKFSSIEVQGIKLASNNNNNNNNNNVNINDDNINFSSTGMQNMMSSGRSQFIRKQQIEFCARYFLCLIRERRYKLNDNEEIALKTLK